MVRSCTVPIWLVMPKSFESTHPYRSSCRATRPSIHFRMPSELVVALSKSTSTHGNTERKKLHNQALEPRPQLSRHLQSQVPRQLRAWLIFDVSQGIRPACQRSHDLQDPFHAHHESETSPQQR